MSNAQKPRSLPGNFGPLKGADANIRLTGPCGDTMEFWIKVDNGRVTAATFTTDGCETSARCGSAAASLAWGQTPETVAAFPPDLVLSATGPLPEESRHCATLALNALKATVADYRFRHAPSSPPRQCPIANASKKRREIVVMSGKGGVGKSFVAVNLAVALSLAGKRVGLLDVDIHGPSAPTLLKLKDARPQVEGEKLLPLEIGSLKVLSIGFLLSHPDDPIIWRGPMKTGMVQKFLTETEWGELDFLIIDAPPGTGDEPLSVCQTLKHIEGAIIVTTPQEVALADARKSINFCKKIGVPVLGALENMSGFVCPSCGTESAIFATGGGESMAKAFKIPFLGRIPLDPNVRSACDDGTPFVYRFQGSTTARAFEAAIAQVLGEAVSDEKNQA